MPIRQSGSPMDKDQLHKLIEVGSVRDVEYQYETLRMVTTVRVTIVVTDEEMVKMSPGNPATPSKLGIKPKRLTLPDKCTHGNDSPVWCDQCNAELEQAQAQEREEVIETAKEAKEGMVKLDANMQAVSDALGRTAKQVESFGRAWNSK